MENFCKCQLEKVIYVIYYDKNMFIGKFSFKVLTEKKSEFNIIETTVANTNPAINHIS